MTRRIITQRQTSREQHEQEAARRGTGANYGWDAILAKVQDPARKPSEAARPAGTAGKVETVDDFEAAAYERRHKALAAAVAAAGPCPRVPRPSSRPAVGGGRAPRAAAARGPTT